MWIRVHAKETVLHIVVLMALMVKFTAFYTEDESNRFWKNFDKLRSSKQRQTRKARILQIAFPCSILIFSTRVNSTACVKQTYDP